MTLSEFQLRCLDTAIYPTDHGVAYCSLGLAGEAGEVANKAKKRIRDGYDKGHEDAIASELGDVLWYAAALAWELKYDLDYIAETMLTKLADRKARGVIGGSGDKR